MTKVTVIGEEGKEGVIKPIEFVKFINMNGILGTAHYCPSTFVEVKVWINEKDVYDLFQAFDDRGNYSWYLGHFNSGIV